MYSLECGRLCLCEFASGGWGGGMGDGKWGNGVSWFFFRAKRGRREEGRKGKRGRVVVMVVHVELGE